jgi:leader peptidase (prepilin peptidase)/N-methyltransferase
VQAIPFGVSAAFALALGAVVGSFLNVVVSRLPQDASVVRPRSRCPRCGAQIAWYDNLPIVSFLVLRARCRACGAPISWRYPALEALGATAALGALLRNGPSLRALAELALVALLLALAFIDLETWLLPHALTWPLVLLGLAASATGLAPAPSLARSLGGAAAGFGAFALVATAGKWVFKKEALGFGDVWLLAGVGAWLGIAALLPVVLLASMQGSVVGIALVLTGRATPGPDRAAPGGDRGGADDVWVPPRNALPFGPFLVVGALEWLYAAGALATAFPPLQVFL